MSKRRTFIRYLTNNYSTQKGEAYPKWLLSICWVLHPLRSFYHYMNNKEGYDINTDTWTINGTKFTTAFFDTVGAKDNNWYRFKKIDGTVQIERKDKVA